MTMLTRVAKAVGDVAFGYVDPDETPTTWDMSLSMARAALIAMREPTDTMIMASVPFNSRQSWQAMIDAALESPSDERISAANAYDRSRGLPGPA
jgi:hypothetical protein